jgi:hypothetical protein
MKGDQTNSVAINCKTYHQSKEKENKREGERK